MHVNNQVVHALMHLRGIDIRTLAGLAHATVSALESWIHQGNDDALSFDQQLEVLSFLGVRSEAPRGDVVHYWHVHESFFSRASSSYWALQLVLKAFGSAEAVFIAGESDPALTFSARAHFGLKFNGFLALLSVTAHPLRNVSFDPEWMADITWTPDTFGVLLPNKEYDGLEPGAMQVKGMTQYLTYSAEMNQWDRLREQAMAQGVRAEQVANLLQSSATSAAIFRIGVPPSPLESGAQIEKVRSGPLIESNKQALVPVALASMDPLITPLRPAHLRRV